MLLSLQTNKVLNLTVYINAKRRVRTGAYNRREERHDDFKAEKKTYNIILMFHIVMLLAYEIHQPRRERQNLLGFTKKKEKDSVREKSPSQIGLIPSQLSPL